MKIEFFETVTFFKVFCFIVGNLRISYLVANEGGPFHVFEKFRNYCKSLCETNRFCREFHLFELVECEFCNSVWFCSSTLILWLIFGDVVLLPLFALAASACVIVGKFIIQNLQELLKLLNKLSS